MFYRGRITSFIVMFLFISIYVCYRYFVEQELTSFEWFYFLSLFILSFFGGFAFDKVSERLFHDELTNIYNRRFIYYLYPILYRKNCIFFVILLDCDDFKVINDTHGHEKGDDVLKIVSSVLKSFQKDKVYASRWGGDEFLLIGKYQSDEQIEKVIESIRKSLCKKFEDTGIVFNISTGYAVFQKDGKSLRELIEHADRKMYEQKNHNRCRLKIEHFSR